MNRTIVTGACGALLLTLPLAGPSFAQSCEEELRQEIETLKQGQEEIRKQIGELADLLRSRPEAPPPPAGPNVRDRVLDLGANPVKGEPRAELTLVEFTDYQ